VGALLLRALAERCVWRGCRRGWVWEWAWVGRGGAGMGTRLDRARACPRCAVRWPPGWSLCVLLHMSRSVGIVASSQGGARGWLWWAHPWDRGLGCSGAPSGMQAGGTSGATPTLRLPQACCRRSPPPVFPLHIGRSSSPGELAREKRLQLPQFRLASSHLTVACSQVPARLQSSRSRRVGFVALEMTSKAWGASSLTSFPLTIELAQLIRPVRASVRGAMHAEGLFSLVRCPSGMDQRADAMGRVSIGLFGALAFPDRSGRACLT
jgi:hypothetical protein